MPRHPIGRTALPPRCMNKISPWSRHPGELSSPSGQETSYPSTSCGSELEVVSFGHPTFTSLSYGRNHSKSKFVIE